MNKTFLTIGLLLSTPLFAADAPEKSAPTPELEETAELTAATKGSPRALTPIPGQKRSGLVELASAYKSPSNESTQSDSSDEPLQIILAGTQVHAPAQPVAQRPQIASLRTLTGASLELTEATYAAAVAGDDAAKDSILERATQAYTEEELLADEEAQKAQDPDTAQQPAAQPAAAPASHGLVAMVKAIHQVFFE